MGAKVLLFYEICIVCVLYSAVVTGGASTEELNCVSINCTYYAYCLMSNHFHLLIREREERVGETIKRIAGSYVYYYNRKYGRDGHLFKERFKSEPVNDMSHQKSF